MIPAAGPYSFPGSSNRLQWHVEVAVRIAGWPDWVQSYPLIVRP